MDKQKFNILNISKAIIGLALLVIGFLTAGSTYQSYHSDFAARACKHDYDNRTHAECKDYINLLSFEEGQSYSTRAAIFLVFGTIILFSISLNNPKAKKFKFYAQIVTIAAVSICGVYSIIAKNNYKDFACEAKGNPERLIDTYCRDYNFLREELYLESHNARIVASFLTSATLLLTLEFVDQDKKSTTAISAKSKSKSKNQSSAKKASSKKTSASKKK